MRIAVAALLALTFVSGAAWALPKVLYVDSYHPGYAWSDGITEGVKTGLAGKADLKVVSMDTKRNNTDEFKQQAGQKVKAEIDAWQPDLVIVADDNASKYVLVPYYKDGKIPFVFCGLNWDASLYGFPCSNVTGMVEVAPWDGLLAQMRTIAKGDRIGILAPDNETGHKEVENVCKKFGLKPVIYYAKDIEDWKKGFTSLQAQVDMLVLESDGGLYDAQKDALKTFVAQNTKVPTGATYDFMSKYALITFGKVAQEQGYWAADAALKILGGKSPTQIPVAQNKEGVLIVNEKILEASKIEVPFEILQVAERAGDRF